MGIESKHPGLAGGGGSDGMPRMGKVQYSHPSLCTDPDVALGAWD